MAEENFWIFSKPGDVRVEARQLANRMREKYGKAADVGFHRAIYLDGADVTAVELNGSGEELADRFREAEGWRDETEKNRTVS